MVTTEVKREIHSVNEVKVYFLSEEELRRLADFFVVVVQTGGTDDKIKWIEFRPPHTDVRITYFN